MTLKTEALRHFKKADPKLYAATKHLHGGLPEALVGKRLGTELFAALVSIVISQQLGTKAADAIFTRVRALCANKITPTTVLEASERDLAAAGLSGAKIKTIKAIAAAVRDGSLDLLALKTMPEDIAMEKLTAIWGLGPWSVEMFMMFALGRSDVFSPGDLGLVRAMEAVYGLPKGVSRDRLLKLAAKWSPHRTYACLLLWRTRNAAPLQQVPGRHSAAIRGTKAGSGTRRASPPASSRPRSRSLRPGTAAAS